MDMSNSPGCQKVNSETRNVIKILKYAALLSRSQGMNRLIFEILYEKDLLDIHIGSQNVWCLQ